MIKILVQKINDFKLLIWFKFNQSELLLIDKPKGITSFDVVRILRRRLGIRKIGHAGTLDPLASGLMILGIEKGTKKLTNLIKLDKDYSAEIILGEKRTTGDMEGDIIESKDISKNRFSTSEIEKALNSMIGELNLPVPVYSAIKRDGQALYKKARKGQKVDPPIKKMKVISANLKKIKYKNKRAHVFVNFSVGSGTYIRSLAEELGKRLGVPATLGNLRRTRVGDFHIKNAYKIKNHRN
jgi:tRNA pseudouridine55 synthase